MNDFLSQPSQHSPGAQTGTRGARTWQAAAWAACWATSRTVVAFLIIGGPFGLLAVALGETPPPAETPAAEAPQTAASPAETPAAVEKIDFARDVEPILAAHCLKCHGAERRSGGLRLDSLAFAEAGGDSGRPIVGGTLETNELVARVASQERTYRMPKNAESLDAREIERIKLWVEQGSPWGHASERKAEVANLGFIDRWLAAFSQFITQYQLEYTQAWPYIIAFLVAQVSLLAVLRAKAGYLKGRSWASGKARWFCKFSSEVRTREIALAWSLVAVAMAVAVMYGHQQRLDRDLAQLRTKRVREVSAWANTIYGSPPVPIRPDHPKQIAGTYYRGNCERNAALFNNGNYLTAVFHIALCDSQHKTVHEGDPVPADGVYLRMELERAPKTADQLFSKDLMASVFLSPTLYESNSSPLQEQPVRLETLEEGQRWVAYVPLGSPNERGNLDGLIYVYTGRITDEMAHGTVHYGIKYELRFDEGQLSADSDLWMNSFGNPAVAMPEPAGKVPYREWFDFRPIPPITGENSTDPKLLGVDEYVKKGLIKAPPAPQPEK